MRTIRSLILPLAAIMAAAAGYWLAREVQDEHVTGQTAADFALRDLDGKSRALSEWRGKLVLVNFWATWCPPCRDEIPLFIKLRAEQFPRGLEVIGVAVDEPDAVRAYSESVGITYPVLLAVDDAFAMMTAYGNSAGVLPYTVLLSPRGEILSQRRGAFAETELAELVARHLPANRSK